LKEQLHGLAWTDATVRVEDRDIMRLIYYSKGVAHFFESAYLLNNPGLKAHVWRVATTWDSWHNGA
jgi:hypothetical protein